MFGTVLGSPGQSEGVIATVRQCAWSHACALLLSSLPVKTQQKVPDHLIVRKFQSEVFLEFPELFVTWWWGKSSPMLLM